MPDDPAAAALDEIRERHTLTVMPDLDPVFFGSLFQIKSHLVRTDVPRLLAAVEAALSRHIPDVIDMADGQFRYCSTCSGHPAWPCPEVAAIRATLAGKEAADEQ